MLEQVSKALNDGEAESQAEAPIAARIVDLMVLFENRLQLALRNSDAGIPDLDKDGSAAPAATHDHSAVLGVFQGVRQQVSDHLFQQARVAVGPQAGPDLAQGKSGRLRLVRKFGRQSLEDIIDRKGEPADLKRAGLDLVDIQQAVEHP